MTGLTVPGFILLCVFAGIGVYALIKNHKNRKGKWTEKVFSRKYDKGIPQSYYYRTKK